jgi:RNA recognition motif-containing protein
MEKKLYVGNLSFGTTEEDLRKMMGEAGSVESVDVIMDRVTGMSKGFAFVTMSTQAEAEKAIAMFNEKTVGDRVIKVNIARPREERPRESGFGRRR